MFGIKKKTVQYYPLSSDTIEGLVARVEAFLNNGKGWHLQGGISCNDGRYYQVVAKN